MTPDHTTDPGVIRNSWDDPEFTTPAEPRIDLLRAVRDDRQRIWEEVVDLRAKVARVEALADEWAETDYVGSSRARKIRAALADPAPVAPARHDDTQDGAR